MPRSQLLWRLYAGYVITIIISTLIVGVLVSRQVTENSSQEIHQSLTVRTALLAEIALQSFGENLNSINFDKLQTAITELGQSTQSRLTIINVDGVVLADSHEQTVNMDNHAKRPEITHARESGFGTTSRFSQTLQQQMIYRAQGIYDSKGEIVGFVRVSLALDYLDNKLSELRLIVLWGAVAAALTALFLGFVFAKKISTPLIRMTEVALAISNGDYEKRIAVNRQDEIGQLAKAFNRMAQVSEQRMKEITADNNRLAMIFAGMVEGVIGVDHRQYISHINQAAAGLLDISATNSINRPIWEVVRIPEITQSMELAMDTGQVVKQQLRRATEAEDLVVDIYVAALSNDSVGSLGAVIVLNDISELDRLIRVRRDFVANASHELKTPITAIRGLTETILDDVDMEAQVKQNFIEKIQSQNLRLSSLVTDLMTLSRLESDSVEQSHQVVNFSHLVCQAVKMAEASCLESKQTLILQEPDEDLKVIGDPQALSQMIDNLLDNAIKYSPEGGDIQLSLEKRARWLNLKVRDAGIGISPQYQLRVFERFYRVDKARSRELGGTGLGLSIVKNIAEQHGGSVSLQSQVGAGSTFTVVLPLN